MQSCSAAATNVVAATMFPQVPDCRDGRKQMSIEAAQLPTRIHPQAFIPANHNLHSKMLATSPTPANLRPRAASPHILARSAGESGLDKPLPRLTSGSLRNVSQSNPLKDALINNPITGGLGLRSSIPNSAGARSHSAPTIPNNKHQLQQWQRNPHLVQSQRV